MLGNVLNLTDRAGRGRDLGRHLISRRSRRLRDEAAEVAEIDLWLATIRSGPEMVLYSAHPAALASASSPTRRAKKRRR